METEPKTLLDRMLDGIEAGEELYVVFWGIGILRQEHPPASPNETSDNLPAA